MLGNLLRPGLAVLFAAAMSGGEALAQEASTHPSKLPQARQAEGVPVESVSIRLRTPADKADAFRASLKSGLDPRVKALRAENGQETPKTVKEAVARYLDSHVKVKNRARWAEEAERLLNVEVRPSSPNSLPSCN